MWLGYSQEIFVTDCMFLRKPVRSENNMIIQSHWLAKLRDRANSSLFLGYNKWNILSTQRPHINMEIQILRNPLSFKCCLKHFWKTKECDISYDHRSNISFV